MDIDFKSTNYSLRLNKHDIICGARVEEKTKNIFKINLMF
jgi:hypothetical protein